MGRREEVERVMEELAGPLTWSDSDHAAGSFGGRPIGLEKRYLATGGAGHHQRELAGVTFTADLGGRPINLWVTLKESRGPGPIPIRDDNFEDKFTVKGWPAESCAAALDANTRRVIAEGFDGSYPTIETKGGQLRYSRRIIFERPERTAEPAELEPYLAAVQFMGWQLVHTFDSTMDELRRTGGDAAAQAWYDEQASAQSGHAARRGARRAIVFGAFFAVAAGIVLAVAYGAGLL